MSIVLKADSRVLFTGDSITDGHRLDTDNPLGYGYPLLVAARWGRTHPERSPTWLNSGIAGNRIADLEARWRADVLDAHPDVVSILVGVNDCGLHFSCGFPQVPAAEYKERYRRLLEPLAQAGTALILVEPFLLPVNDEQLRWRDDLDAKIDIVHRLARDYDAALTAADRMFADLAATTGPQHWAADGVHPTPAGHQALADAWLEQVE